MTHFFNSSIGRLRILAILEGISLLILIGISLPLKYYFDNSWLTSQLGPIHGVLFLLFVINAISVSTEQGWKFRETTWKVLLACLIPFGTFYIDYFILKPIHQSLK